MDWITSIFKKIFEKVFTSRKAMVIAGYIVLSWANKQFELGLDDDTMKRIIDGIIVFITGQSAVDVATVIRDMKIVMPEKKNEGESEAK